MRRLLICSVLFAAGCQNVDGPFRRASAERPDSPAYSIAEQERRGRSAYAIPDDTGVSGPRSGAARPYLGSGR